MIIDCTMFFNELDLLEIRLEEHNSFVDKFIIIEANSTHSNSSKEYILDQNYDRYKKFHNKIQYVKINLQDKYKYNIVSWNKSSNIASNKELWSNENFQRNYALITLENDNTNDEDIIICSDLDEIIDYKTFVLAKEQLNRNDIIKCKQKHYAYKLNLYCGQDTAGPKILKYKTLKNIDISLLREYDIGKEIEGGWHFSFLSDNPENAYYKFKAFSHSYQNLDVTDPNLAVSKLKKCLIKEKIEIDQSFPKSIIDNLDRYKNFIEK